MTDLRPLRPHQQRALEELRRSLLSGKRRPMLQAPTGFGKTLVAAHIIQRAVDKEKRVAFVVPALNLAIDQTVSAFEAEGLHAIGVMQGIHPRTDREQRRGSRCAASRPSRGGGGRRSISSLTTRRTSITVKFTGGWPTARTSLSSACRRRHGLAAWANISTT